MGISKYFIKPFDPEEVIEHINKIAPKLRKQKQVILKDDFIFDNNTSTLYKNSSFVILSKREKEFLHLLIRHKNTLVSTQEIKKTLWSEEVYDETLRTFIKRFRLKTSKNIIENISGQGYLISVLND